MAIPHRPSAILYYSSSYLVSFVLALEFSACDRLQTMTDPTGRLDIELQRQDGRLKTSIRSSRPTEVVRVFVGKTIQETVSGLPALFSVCANAQACACASACEAALGLIPSPAVVRLQRLLVDVETVKEHLWRILLDWPRFLGEPARERDMSKVMGAFLRLRALLTGWTDPRRPDTDAEELDAAAAAAALDELALLSATQILGVGPGNWLAGTQTPEDLLAWAERTGTVAARLVRQLQARGWVSAGKNPVTALPCLTAADLNLLLSGRDANRFVAEPLWRGEPRESSPFTRRQGQAPMPSLVRKLGNGLLPRLAAQLVELASLQKSLRTGLDTLGEPMEPLAVSAGEGVGIAQVQAARGLLVHRAEVVKGRVSDYRILAPTEWNFHPQGVVARGLSKLAHSDPETLGRQANLFITAVDPCVDYHLVVT